MNDLIDRTAAIYALKAKAVPLYKDPGCNDIWERDRTLDNAIDVIRGLPSAESEIIKCKDCKYMMEHYDTNGNAPYWTCYEWGSETDYDGFCHYAERRADELGIAN